MKDIKTIYGLANYLNESEEYPDDVSEIIKKNGWKVLDVAKREICTAGHNVLYFDAEGFYDIFEIEHPEFEFE